MSNSLHTNNEISFWTCLHDGSLESLASDALARTLTFVFDVSYIWTFHKLPESSRFHLALVNVSKAVALDHSHWPEELEVPEGLSWDESQKLRLEHYAKGRYESLDWNTVVSKLSEHDASNASYSTQGDQIVLTLDLTDYEGDYPKLEITAERLAISMNGTEGLTLEEFLYLGNAYWDAFGNRSF